MKLLLCIIASAISWQASAQLSIIGTGAGMIRRSVATRQHSLSRLDYRVDTLHYYGMLIPKQRFSDRDLMGALGNNTTENNVILQLQKLQDQLDLLNKYLMQHRELNFINVAQDHIDFIKQSKPDFNLSVYEQEYAFYRSYADTFGNGERERRKAEALAEQKAREDYEAEQRYKKHLADSVALVREREIATIDSLNDIQEAKAQRAFEAKCLKKYGAKYGKAIIEHRVLLGMNKEMCELSWGSDHHTTAKTTKGGVSETWTYGVRQYIVFTNGIATTVAG